MPSVKLHPTDIILHKLKLNWCVLARSTTVTVTHRSSPLMWVYSDRCNKNRDPLERVKFFKRFDDQTATSIDRSKLMAFCDFAATITRRAPLSQFYCRTRVGKIAMLLPSQFEERAIRVFTRRSDPDVMSAVQLAFRKCVRSRCSSAGLTPHPLSRLHSPQKPPRGAGPQDVFAVALAQRFANVAHNDEDETDKAETPKTKKTRLHEK